MKKKMIVNESVTEFINSITVENTRKTFSILLKNIHDVSDADIKNCSMLELEKIISDLKPSCPRTIRIYIYVLKTYGEWLKNKGDNRLYKIAKQLDLRTLWEINRVDAPKKFISNKDYMELMLNIECDNDLDNKLFYKTFLECLYEGVYCDDLSVLANLRVSNIDKENKIITLNNSDNETYKLSVSDELIQDLIELERIKIWERRNPYGFYNVRIDGVYPDSCFKRESKVNSNDLKLFRSSYYGKFRKLIKRYYGKCNMYPNGIYTSGIMYRIRILLEENGIKLEDAFNGYNSVAREIILSEMKRCNNKVILGNFKESVKGNLEIFQK